MGIYNKFYAKDIHVGDLVYFDDSPMQSNYDEFWEVTNVNNSSGVVSVKLNYVLEDRYHAVHCSDIRQFLSSSKKIPTL